MLSPLKLLTAAIATATLSLAVPRPAEAQFTNPYTFSTWNNPISSSADTAIMNRVFQRMVEGGPTGSAPAAPATPAPLSASTFRPVAAQIIPQRLATNSTLSPTEQQEMATLYSDLLEAYHDWLVEEGEQRLRNNVAGAMLYLVQASHYVLYDGEELSLADQEAILQDFNAALAGDWHFQQLSPQAKQELYETLIISASLPLALYVEGYEVGDLDSVAEAQAMVEAVLVAILSPS